MSSEHLQPEAPDWAERLIQLLLKQQALVQRLGELAGRQRGLIEGHRTDALLELLAERQGIIDQFTATQDELGDLTGSLQSRLAGTPAPQADRIRTLLDAIGHELGEVMQRDEADQQTLEAGRAGVRNEITTLNTAAQARGAYLKPRPVVNRFADRKG